MEVKKVNEQSFRVSNSVIEKKDRVQSKHNKIPVQLIRIETNSDK